MSQFELEKKYFKPSQKRIKNLYLIITNNVCDYSLKKTGCCPHLFYKLLHLLQKLNLDIVSCQEAQIFNHHLRYNTTSSTRHLLSITF